jgi:hypothetical protein
MDAYDTHLVLSFVGETRFLALNEDDELDEAEIRGFDATSQVRLCACVPTAFLSRPRFQPCSQSPCRLCGAATWCTTSTCK